MGKIIINVFKDEREKCERRNRNINLIGRMRIEGNEIEDMRKVKRNLRIRGEEGKIGINKRCDGMIIEG